MPHHHALFQKNYSIHSKKKSSFTKLNISATIAAGISSILPEVPSVVHTTFNVLNQVPKKIARKSQEIIDVSIGCGKTVFNITHNAISFSRSSACTLSYKIAKGIQKAGCQLAPLAWGAAGGIAMGYIGYVGLCIYSNYQCSKMAAPFLPKLTPGEWEVLGCSLEHTVGELGVRAYWACPSHVYASVNTDYYAQKNACYNLISDSYFLTPFKISAGLGMIYGIDQYKEAPSPSTLLTGISTGGVTGAIFALLKVALASDFLMLELKNLAINHGCTIVNNSFMAKCRTPVLVDIDLREQIYAKLSEQTLWNIYIPWMVGIALCVFNSRYIVDSCKEQPQDKQKVSDVTQTLFSNTAAVNKRANADYQHAVNAARRNF